MIMDNTNSPAGQVRLRLAVRGAVQGVGFRPFVFRLASELSLTGWVMNTGMGASIEIEGMRVSLEQFLLRLESERPPHCFLESLEPTWLDPAGHSRFDILPSAVGPPSAIILPDLATCPECLAEIRNPANRRYRYPFTNCTHCGPRFSIIRALPYDRVNTSMATFRMCPECQAEYDAPENRRFHAQPNACPKCGPWLELRTSQGAALCTREEALSAAADALRQGQILALKGLGGFQLITAAHDDAAVKRLRRRKAREEKPFALMFPTVEQVRRCCEVDSLEARLLCSPESPIVLLRKRSAAEKSGEVAPSVAPGNPDLGVMLPYTPLHHLLLSEVGFPVVATSGNISDEPICIAEDDALGRLGAIADMFLVHNRPIVRHVDDSVVRMIGGRELVLRRARGYAPLPVPLRQGPPATTVLAVGAHLKNAVALLRNGQVFVSQHIGDLETVRAKEAFSLAANDLMQVYHAAPGIIAADAHPDYASTRWATEQAASAPNCKLVQVQHHLAHVLSCMAENELQPPVLGVAWDGTGLGTDGTIWGGEFLLVRERDWSRAGYLRPFSLPGGELAIREPRRSAAGLLYERFGARAFEMKQLPSIAAFTQPELGVLQSMLARGINSPRTSSVGRLFDAFAAILGLRQRTSFEGQSAMELECAADRHPAGVMAADTPCLGRFALVQTDSPEGKMLAADWGPVLDAVLEGRAKGLSTALLARSIHEALVDLILQMARAIGEPRIVLSGGCFQNATLLRTLPSALARHGFKAYWHQRIPPNDGGICVGQVVAALRETL